MSGDHDAWQAAGFSDTARESFRQWNIALKKAEQWRAAGVPDGLIATRWSIAGVEPGQVRDWQKAGFDALEAMQWCQHGHDLSSATREKAAGRAPGAQQQGTSQMIMRGGFRGFRGPNGEEPGPAFRAWLESGQPTSRVMHEYRMTGWISDEALPWLQEGIAPQAARTWIVLGVRAREAAELERQAKTSNDVVRDWWSAGVPLHQVADWLGAGFTPQEARDHLAAGIDAERAAVLRALRDGTED